MRIPAPIVLLFLFISFNAVGQKGKLFIIGGGHRSEALINTLIKTAGLQPKDHIVVLPMSSEEGDSAYYYIKLQLEKACSNTIANLNFTSATTGNTQWLDSVKSAKLIFITGGDQSRFMKIVAGSPLYKAIHDAYKSGATVAGTSAGAAVMCRHMITGKQLRGDSVYHATFDRLWTNNIEFSEGLGLIDSVIIDQHFIVRSRYNRLLSALDAYPTFTCIGIDEATAIIVAQQQITIAGDGQVLVFRQPKTVAASKGELIKMKDVRLDIYTAGEGFKLPENPANH